MSDRQRTALPCRSTDVPHLAGGIRFARPPCRGEEEGGTRVKTGMKLAACIVCGLVCASARAKQGEALRDFLRAMLRKDTQAMRAIVRGHRDEMAVTFFVSLRQSSGELKGPLTGGDDALTVRAMLLLCARIAQTFDEVYPSRNVLYEQFKDSRPLLTGNVRGSVTSDRSLAAFLDSSVKTLAMGGGRYSVAADLESIFAAASESPADRALRKLREMQERLRREEADRLRRERLAKMTAQCDRLIEARDEQGLLAMLQDVTLDVSVKGKVVVALGELRSRSAVGELSKLLTYRRLAGAVVDALGRIGDDRAMDVLSAHATDAAIKGRIVEALGKVHSDRSAEVLVGMLGDEDAGPRAAALLTRAWGVKASARFIEVARDRSRGRAGRRQAVRALGDLGGPEGSAELANLAGDPELKGAAAEALSRMGDPRAAGVLVAMLDDEEAAPVAMAGLGRMGPPAIPALVDRLRRFSPSAGIKRAAQVLEDLEHRPRTGEEKARLAVARGRVVDAVTSGAAGAAVALKALTAGDGSVRWTGAGVLAVDVGLPALLLAGLGLYLRREWVWPSLRARLGPGECRQYHGAVKPCPGEGNVQPGTILQTLWAQSRRGRRQRIKVETFVAGEAWEIVGENGLPFEDTAPRAQGPGERYDLLVSVGRSVRPGTYLARAPNGSIRVRVTAGRA